MTCWNRQKNNRKRRIFGGMVVFFVWLSLTYFVGTVQMIHVEQAQKEVFLSPSEKKQQIYFFYRDDCKDCHQIFPIVWWQSFFFKQTVFINLNVPANRKYIQMYHLQEVPTIYIADKEIQWTSLWQLWWKLNGK